MKPGKIAKLIALSPRRHFYLLAAVIRLAQARIDFFRRPVRDILARLQDTSGIDARIRHPFDVDMLSWGLRTAANHVPWRADCLIQSMAADRWLRQKGIRPAFRLGVSSSAAGSLQAHAWIELDGVVLTGGEYVSHYELLIDSKPQSET